MNATPGKWAILWCSLLGVGLAAGPVFAGWPGDAAKCKKDMIKAGSVCIDTYEASVWEIPAVKSTGKSNKGLVTKVQNGTATLADLTAGEAVQRGVASDDYECLDNGQDCKDEIYAVSLAGVKPSAYITWFQARQACANSRKRLPSNADWQMAVAGTPDPGAAGDNDSTTCNVTNDPGQDPVNTGSRTNCQSAWGAYDMVGNLFEWTAEWMPASTTCLAGGWNDGFSDDYMCLAGASTTTPGPGALLRGGGFTNGDRAGPFAISAMNTPQTTAAFIGFRCAR